MDWLRLEGRRVVKGIGGNRRVRSTRLRIPGTKIGARISTVLLPIDHIGGKFETMIFVDGKGLSHFRCDSYDDAVKMHKAVLRLVKRGLFNERG